MDKKLEMVANLMDPKPSPVENYHKGHLPVISKGGWWIWRLDKWLPNKDPRTDIAAAFEVLLNINYENHTWLLEYSYCFTEKRYLITCYIRGRMFKDNSFLGYGDTPEQAIFEAVVKLIDYLKEKEND